MKVHDPDNEIPEEGARFRHHRREKSDVVGLSADQTNQTSIEPAYTVEVVQPRPQTVGGSSEVEMRIEVEVVSTEDPEYLEVGYRFPMPLKKLKGEHYTRLQNECDNCGADISHHPPMISAPDLGDMEVCEDCFEVFGDE